MITDAETNTVFLADSLVKQEEFFRSFNALLESHRIVPAILPHTKDIWAVDYMPIQVSKKRFVQFAYRPDYLVKYKKYHHLITETSKVCQAIGCGAVISDIVLDGGNVIRGDDWVICTDKIFTENPRYTRTALVSELEELLEARVIIIPRFPGDFTGHADGIVRHYSADTVLVNRYHDSDHPAFQRSLLKALDKAGLGHILIPYAPYGNDHAEEAHGLYINFLQLQGLIVLPVFDLPEDAEALSVMNLLFPDCELKVINARCISAMGGVLNCITWNVQR